MKTFEISPLKSNWKTPFAKGKMPKRGISRFKSRLSQRDYDPRPSEYDRFKKVRVANVRRMGNKGFKIIGVENLLTGPFSSVKNQMKEMGFSGYRMGAVKSNLI